jgi:hypothetical protein
MYGTHLDKPFGKSRPPKTVLRLQGTGLEKGVPDRVAVEVFVGLEQEPERILCVINFIPRVK